jgi:hypothetical protein
MIAIWKGQAIIEGAVLRVQDANPALEGCFSSYPLDVPIEVVGNETSGLFIDQLHLCQNFEVIRCHLWLRERRRSGGRGKTSRDMHVTPAGISINESASVFDFETLPEESIRDKTSQASQGNGRDLRVSELILGSRSTLFG